MYDITISIISEYVYNNLSYPETYPKGRNDYFEDMSYERWAAYEIIERLSNEVERLPPHITGSRREPIPPIDIISDFLDEMEGYVRNGCNKKHKRIFTIAKDFAEGVILLFL